MTAAAAVRARPAAGRAAQYGHVLAGVELDGPAQRLAALLDPSFLSAAGIRRAGCCPCLPGIGCWAARYAGLAGAPRRNTPGSAECVIAASPG
jgi:hypothetical protein